jgi:hypothetical protein
MGLLTPAAADALVTAVVVTGVVVIGLVRLIDREEQKYF